MQSYKIQNENTIHIKIVKRLALQCLTYKYFYSHLINVFIIVLNVLLSIVNVCT